MIKNPITGRRILIGGKAYTKLLAKGLIEPPDEEKPEEKERPEQKTDFEEKLINTSIDVAKENITKFKKISQEESDELLKRLLYEKLCLEPQKNESRKVKFKKNKKHRKKKKKKHFLMPSSSESESSSESSSSESN
jgi:hypothetical protein